MRKSDFIYRVILIGATVSLCYQFIEARGVVVMLASWAALGMLLKFVFHPTVEPGATTVTFKFWGVWRFIVFLWNLPRHWRALKKTTPSE